MIIKSNEDLKIQNSKSSIYLFYGQNRALKNKLINLLANKDQTKINYEELEILNRPDLLNNMVSTKSFFEISSLVIIKRTSEKILNIIESLVEKNLSDIKIILDAGLLDKRSKLRKFFENNKKLVCIPFYEDNESTLYKIATNFFSKKNIKISQQNISLLVNKSKGDRKNLEDELEKIDLFLTNKKSIKIEELNKLINLKNSNNFDELIDNFLAKNKIRLLKTLNENVLSNEDNISIIRTLLFKSKRLKIILKNLKFNKNIDEIISIHRPPIFWKDKEIIKQQVKKNSFEEIKTLIKKINYLEVLIKKNSVSSYKLLNNFMLEHSQ